jgi:hypothetical protein
VALATRSTIHARPDRTSPAPISTGTNTDVPVPVGRSQAKWSRDGAGASENGAGRSAGAVSGHHLALTERMQAASTAATRIISTPT